MKIFAISENNITKPLERYSEKMFKSSVPTFFVQFFKFSPKVKVLGVKFIGNF